MPRESQARLRGRRRRRGRGETLEKKEMTKIRFPRETLGTLLFEHPNLIAGD